MFLIIIAVVVVVVIAVLIGSALAKKPIPNPTPKSTPKPIQGTTLKSIREAVQEFSQKITQVIAVHLLPSVTEPVEASHLRNLPVPFLSQRKNTYVWKTSTREVLAEGLFTHSLMILLLKRRLTLLWRPLA